METTCTFCNKGAPYMPQKEMEQYGAKVYYCKRCHAEYIHWEGGARATTSIYITINDKLYRWSYANLSWDKMPTARLWYIEHPGIPGETRNQGCVVLASFGPHGTHGTSIPDITPRNVKQKIKTYLVML